MNSIYFCGASGQGKSSTANVVADILGLPVIDGVSRNSVHKFGTDVHQQWLSKTIYRMAMCEIGIHCRTPLDVYAYTDAYDAYSPTDELNVRFWSFTNPCVIYFPLYFTTIENDGQRPTDLAFNQHVDDTLQELLRRYNFEYLTLSDNSPEERAEEIIKYWSSYDPQSLLEQPGDLSDV